MDFFAITEDSKTQNNQFERPVVKNHKPLILVVEESADNREMFRCLLEMWNYRVLEAADAAEALKIATKTPPDLILMDVRPPHFDGFETTRRLRETETNSRVPIVILSAYAEKITRPAALTAGADEYLAKPLDFDLLEIVIEKHISRQPEIFRKSP